MLTTETTAKINAQIQAELKTVNSFVSDDSEKAAALDRIMKLKQILEPTPSPDQIMKLFVQAIESQPRTPQTSSAAETLSNIFELFRK